MYCYNKKPVGHHSMGKRKFGGAPKLRVSS